MYVTIPKYLLVYDPDYSYMRPIVEIGINSDNNITEIKNITAICKSIHTPLKIIKKWMKKEIGLSLTKNCSVDGLYIKGIYNATELDEIIEDFIVNNVLCPLCAHPETETGICIKCGAIL